MPFSSCLARLASTCMKFTTWKHMHERSSIGLAVFRSESIPQKGLCLVGTDLDLPYCVLASNTSMSKSFLLHLHLHGNDLALLRRVRNCLTLMHSCATVLLTFCKHTHKHTHSTNRMHKEALSYFFRSAILIWWALYCKHFVPKSSKLWANTNSSNVLNIVENGCTMSL